MSQRLLPLFLLTLLLNACGQDTDTAGLTLWAHAGQPGERRVLAEQVARFNARTDGPEVEVKFIPEKSYNAQTQAAALAGELPDLLELDGPYVATYAWQGRLRPLDDLLPAAVKEDLLESLLVQGTYGDKLYAVGSFESGLGLFVRPSVLKQIGARLPTHPREAWSAKEFDEILRKIADIDKAKDGDGAVLDLKLNYAGEWFTYGFAPALHSAGGRLLAEDGTHATGILDGEPSVSALERIQSWIRDGLVDPNLDDQAFVSGRVALSWVGHWAFPDYRAALGDDLAVVPLPNFGQGTRTGQGSWAWGISRTSHQPEAAARFLVFILQPDEVLAMTEANGAVPGTQTSLGDSGLYGPKRPLQLFSVQLQEGYSVPRPRSPAYSTITNHFQRVFQELRDGSDVRDSLTKAAQAIDQEISDNRGYPLVSK